MRLAETPAGHIPTAEAKCNWLYAKISRRWADGPESQYGRPKTIDGMNKSTQTETAEVSRSSNKALNIDLELFRKELTVSHRALSPPNCLRMHNRARPNLRLPLGQRSNRPRG